MLIQVLSPEDSSVVGVAVPEALQQSSKITLRKPGL